MAIIYAVIGCPDLQSPDGSTVVHTTEDEVLVTCAESDLEAVMVCINNKWAGELPNCPKSDDVTIQQSGICYNNEQLL